ncbi:hypothetical protein ACU4GD_20655 [Cupriavidus basilensis]
MAPDTITLTMRQIDRLKIIQALADGFLKTGIAAARLDSRHARRCVCCGIYQAVGAPALLNGHQGLPGNNQLPPGLESRVRRLIRDTYADFGPTLAAEKLRERHGINLSAACVRRIMIDAGFWVPRKLRSPKVHQPRNRRACLGELVQIDGSDHAWFRGAGAGLLRCWCSWTTPPAHLMQLLFVPTESTFGYFEAARS